MLPETTPVDRVDGANGHTVLFRESGLNAVRVTGLSDYAPDFSHVGFREYCARTFLAAMVRDASATLSPHVTHVVGLCPKEKMIRVGTWRIVATVKNAKSVRDFSTVNLPRDAVRVDAFLGAVSAEPRGDNTVPVFVPFSLPTPTTVLDNGLLSVALRDRYAGWSIAHQSLVYNAGLA